jgi:hypothetical protein
VQPVLTFGRWQVETVAIDRGSGLREWIEVRGGDETAYCATAAELQRLLRDRGRTTTPAVRHGLDLATFTEVDTIDDGCE